MSPEDKVNRDLWYVLQRVKEEGLRSRSGSPIQYWVETGRSDGEIPSSRNEILALEKLAELGVINILNPGGTPDYV